MFVIFVIATLALTLFSRFFQSKKEERERERERKSMVVVEIIIKNNYLKKINFFKVCWVNLVECLVGWIGRRKTGVTKVFSLEVTQNIFSSNWDRKLTRETKKNKWTKKSMFWILRIFSHPQWCFGSFFFFFNKTVSFGFSNWFI